MRRGRERVAPTRSLARDGAERGRVSPLVDADPHFNRVVRYFRPADYGIWAAGTVAAPAILGVDDGEGRVEVVDVVDRHRGVSLAGVVQR
jgi:hypothetical protein